MASIVNRILGIRYIQLILLAVLVLLFLWAIPLIQVHSHRSELALNESIQLENEIRKTWAQSFGIIGGIILLFLTLKRIEVAHEGQITERFTKAIDHLGTTNKDGEKILEVRLGGIYALERIARDSKGDHQAVMEVLTAYVRENAPWTSEKEETVEYFISRGVPPTNPKAPADIQAILTVLGRRTLSHEKQRITGFVDLRETETGLDLRKTDLRWIEVFNLSLQKAILWGANLAMALLPGSDLRGANLQGANLFKAQLIKANFHKAILKHAHLRETTLVDAILQEADLTKANLQGGFLGGANFKKAILVDANFTAANIQGSAKFSEADLRGANFESAELMYADFQNANLSGAIFLNADLTGANLIGASKLTIDQLSGAKTLHDSKLDPDIEKRLRKDSPNLFEGRKRLY